MSGRVRDRLPPVEFVAIAIAVLVAATVILVFATRGGGDGLSSGPPMRAARTLSPRALLFGDTLTARLSLAADTSRVDASSIRIEPRFGDYRPVVPPTLERRVIRGAEYISWTATLRCLELACLPGDGATRARVGPARVTYSTIGDDGARVPRTMVVRWPPALVYTRVDRAELAASDPRGEPPWRAELSSLPAVTFRASPSLIAVILYGIGAALIVGALAVLRPILRPLLKWSQGDGRAPSVPALEQALELLERNGEGVDVHARREALELIAAELARRGEHELELSARRLAWSEDPPPNERTHALAQRVRGLDGASNGRAA